MEIFSKYEVRSSTSSVFLETTCFYVNGAERKMWRRGGTGQPVKKRRKAASTTYTVLHAGAQNVFVSDASLISVLGMKSGDYYDSVDGEDFQHLMLTQFIPNLDKT
jgi:hypothetical protein